MGFFSPKNTPENAVKAQIDAKLAFINDKYTEIGRFVNFRSLAYLGKSKAYFRKSKVYFF